MKITLLLPALLHVGLAVPAQLPNAKTETIRIAGNCGLCKQAIEAAGIKKGEAVLSWNADTRLAELTYDSVATTADDVLKRVAYAGYDNERYLAPAEAYAALDSCCQYERAPQAATLSTSNDPATAEHGTSHASHPSPTTGHRPPTTTYESSIHGVLQSYFKLKDALVAGNGKDASTAAIALSKQLKGLSRPEAKQASAQAAAVAKAAAIEDQRAKFAELSASLYRLAKMNAPSATVYYQHCPMYNKGKGANWLSQEKAIRNPYYGDQMLTCGSVVDTLGASVSETHHHE